MSSRGGGCVLLYTRGNFFWEMMMSKSAIEQAKLLLELKRYRDAESLLGEVIAREPDNDVAHRLLSLALTRRRRPLEGLSAAKKAIGLAPEEPAGYYVKTLAFMELNNLTGAREAIQKAIRLNPNNAEYYGRLSAIHMGKQEWKKAYTQAEKGLQLDPYHIQCANVYATVCALLGKHEQSDHAHRVVMSVNPGYAAAHNNRGVALLHAGKFAEAEASFQEAVRLDPMQEEAARNMIIMRYMQNPIYRWMFRYTLWIDLLIIRNFILALFLYPLVGLSVVFRAILSLYRWCVPLSDKIRGV